MSNPNLHIFGNAGIVSKGKGKMMPTRNRSKIIGGRALLEDVSSCNKRHYGRYFSENYNSCLS